MQKKQFIFILTSLVLTNCSSPNNDANATESSASNAESRHMTEDCTITNGPLLGLPSLPGKHLDKLKKLGKGEWLNLGVPGGNAVPGVSFNPSMPLASCLRGAFQYGTGIHGHTIGKYYDDGLYFYNINSNKWITAFPGTHIPSFANTHSVNSDGFEVEKNGKPVPVAPLVHGYGLVTFDSKRQRFMSMVVPGKYWQNTFPTRVTYVNKLNETHASPWIWETIKGQWNRLVTKTKIPKPNPSKLVEQHLIYLPSTDKVLWTIRNYNNWLYDPSNNTWTKTKSKRIGYGLVSDYDPLRDRVWFGGNKQAKEKSRDSLRFYDVQRDELVFPKTNGDLPQGGYKIQHGLLHYDIVNDRIVVFKNRGKGAGVYHYDPNNAKWSFAGTWPEEILDKTSHKTFSGFYDPVTNIHFIHVSHNGLSGGQMWAYRAATRL